MKRNNYALGIDIGITSVGWGIIDTDDKVVAAGVRLFEEVDASENVKRRGFRGARRIKRRRKHRVERMKRLLIREGYIDESFHTLSNPYELRVKGLKELLAPEEFATALLHLVKRRGSHLETVDESDGESAKDAEKAKQVLAKNHRQLVEEKKHVCELQLERWQKYGQIRGSENIFHTEDYLRELDALLKTQNIPDNVAEAIRDLISTRRHYSEGPGSLTSPTPYGRFRRNEEGVVETFNLIELMRGKCSVYPEELRAPKLAISVEIFNFLNDLNNLKVHNQPITTETKLRLLGTIREKGCLPPKTKPFEALAKSLGVEPEYITNHRIDANKKPLISTFDGYQKMLKIMQAHHCTLEDETIDQIAAVLTSHKTKEDRIENLQVFLDDEKIIGDFADLKGFTQYHSMSLRAVKEINTIMIEENKNQMQIIHEHNLGPQT
ncbi:MAG: type II CRISPR RNA-guided endonuclease Cas9, partial [Acholeplasmatales bacterium]